MDTITENNSNIIIICTNLYKQMLCIIFKVQELGPLTCTKITLVIQSHRCDVKIATSI